MPSVYHGTGGINVNPSFVNRNDPHLVSLRMSFLNMYCIVSLLFISLLFKYMVLKTLSVFF